MSSPTIFFVLERSRRISRGRGNRTASARHRLAFGPGLTLEAAALTARRGD